MKGGVEENSRLGVQAEAVLKDEIYAKDLFRETMTHNRPWPGPESNTT